MFITMMIVLAITGVRYPVMYLSIALNRPETHTENALDTLGSGWRFSLFWQNIWRWNRAT